MRKTLKHKRRQETRLELEKIELQLLAIILKQDQILM